MAIFGCKQWIWEFGSSVPPISDVNSVNKLEQKILMICFRYCSLVLFEVCKILSSNHAPLFRNIFHMGHLLWWLISKLFLSEMCLFANAVLYASLCLSTSVCLIRRSGAFQKIRRLDDRPNSAGHCSTQGFCLEAFFCILGFFLCPLLVWVMYKDDPEKE